MRPIYLLDTNIISEIYKKNPDPKVYNAVKEHISLSAVSSVSWHEMLYGMKRKTEGKSKDLLSDFLMNFVDTNFEKIPYDEHAAFIHSELRVALEQHGILIPYADFQIACIAKANNMILVTRNTRDFEKIPGLMLENWFE